MVIGIFVIAFITISLVFAAISSVIVGFILGVNISRVRVIANFTPSTSRAVIYFIVLIIMLVAVGRLTNVTIILVVCIVEIISSTIVLLLVAIVIIVPSKIPIVSLSPIHVHLVVARVTAISVRLLVISLNKPPLVSMTSLSTALLATLLVILLSVTLLLPLHEPGIVHVWRVHGLIFHSSIHIWTRGICGIPFIYPYMGGIPFCIGGNIVGSLHFAGMADTCCSRHSDSKPLMGCSNYFQTVHSSAMHPLSG